MKLSAAIALNAAGGINWQSPASPAGADWYETYIGLAPISTFNPPSLKNPIKVKVPTAQDGWHRGDSKAARDQAIADLVEIHKRLRRQIGKPEISQTAIMPVYPGQTGY